MDRLQNLVFSFYREDPQIKFVLQPLLLCRFTLSWESVRIDCLDAEHLQEVSQLLVYLRPPFSSLGIGQRIVLRAPGQIPRGYPMQVGSDTELMKE